MRRAVLYLAIVAVVLIAAVIGVARLREAPVAGEPDSTLPPLDQVVYETLWPERREVTQALTQDEHASVLRVCLTALREAPLDRVPVAIAEQTPPPGTVGLSIQFASPVPVERTAPSADGTARLSVKRMVLARAPDPRVPGGRGVLWARSGSALYLVRSAVELTPDLQSLLNRLETRALRATPRPVRVTLWLPDGRPLEVPAESPEFAALAAAAQAIAPLTDRVAAQAMGRRLGGGYLLPPWAENPAATVVAVTYDRGLSGGSHGAVADTVLLADARDALPHQDLLAAAGPWSGDLWLVFPLDRARVLEQGEALRQAVVAALAAHPAATEPQRFAPANCSVHRVEFGNASLIEQPDPDALATIIEAAWFAARWLPFTPTGTEWSQDAVQVEWRMPVLVERLRWPLPPDPYFIRRCTVWLNPHDDTHATIRFETHRGAFAVVAPLVDERGGIGLPFAFADAVAQLRGP